MYDNDKLHTNRPRLTLPPHIHTYTQWELVEEREWCFTRHSRSREGLETMMSSFLMSKASELTPAVDNFCFAYTQQWHGSLLLVLILVLVSVPVLVLVLVLASQLVALGYAHDNVRHVMTTSKCLCDSAVCLSFTQSCVNVSL